MASKSFNNIKELEAFINKEIKKAMVNGCKVKDEVIETGKRHVQSDVYDVYEPLEYSRTGELKESWDVQESQDGIDVFNTRTDEGRDIPYIVESGKGYQHNFAYKGVPRPFMENTRKELEKGNRLSDALKDDMKKAGYDVR